MHPEKVGAFRANRTEKVGAFRANKTQKRGTLPRHIPILLYYGSTPPGFDDQLY